MYTSNPELLSLYDKLARLTESDEFFFKDFEVSDDVTYRVFCYRYASPGAWIRPGALEARGITYAIDRSSDRLLGVVCRPMEKFFNLNENAFTQGLDSSNVVRVMDKVDGSLVSSLILPSGKLHLKSKTSLFSEQAVAATKLLHEGDEDLIDEIEHLTSSGYTVNMEYTAPDNRIVIAHQKSGLTVLNVRSHDGQYLTISAIKQFPAIWRQFVAGRCTDRMSPEERDMYLNPDNIRGQVGHEGYIWVMDTGQMVKLKTEWYVAKHKAKEGAFNFRFVFTKAVEGDTDDLKAAVSDDAAAMDYIKRVEDTVYPAINKAMSTTARYHAENKGLARKDYAIKARAEIPDYFALAMQAFTADSQPDFVGWATKRYDTFKEIVGTPKGVVTE